MDYRIFKETFKFNLNKQQEQALQNVEGPALLLAIPGSGKTTTLVWRIGYMIYVKGIEPSSILIITFTRAAAEDIRRRYIKIFGPDYSDMLDIRTINSLCYSVVTEYSRRSGRQKPEDLTDNYNLIQELYIRTQENWPTENDVKNVQLEITRAKNMMMNEEEISRIEVDGCDFYQIYKTYQRYLKDRFLMDYDDQLDYAYRFLKALPPLLEIFQEKYRYILVDEAQDTSKLQHAVIDLLASKYRNVFMVGDEDQSIYGFRAAYPEAILNFQTRYPEASVMKIEQNYRSTPEIVKLADYIIRFNRNRYAKKMTTENLSGPAVDFINCSSRGEQYEKLAEMLPQLDGTTAILYRNNDSAVPVINALTSAGLDFSCRGLDRVFFNNKIIRDLRNIMDYSKARNDESLFMDIYSRLGARVRREQARAAIESYDPSIHDNFWDSLAEVKGISKSLAEKAETYSREFMFMGRTEDALMSINRICNHLEYKFADDDRIFLLKSLIRKGDTIAQFWSRLEELENRIEEFAGKETENYVLSTIHGSKGLEYDNVILIDELTPIFPDRTSDIEEERRLFYVAITRARRKLILVDYQSNLQPFVDACRDYYRKFNVACGKDYGRKENTMSKTSAAGKTGHHQKKIDPASYVEGAAVYSRTFGSGVIQWTDGRFMKVKFEGVYGVKKFDKAISAKAGAIEVVK